VTIHTSGRGVRSPGLHLDRLTRPQLWAASSAAVVALAAFLPWYSAFGLGVSGMRGPGRLTFACAVAALAVVAFATDVVGRRRLTRQAYFLGSVPAVAVVLLTALRRTGDGAGLGLYLTLGAGLVWLAALLRDVHAYGRSPGPYGR
jgi:hypothetical protein